jgi:predicted nucleotidyltransferase
MSPDRRGILEAELKRLVNLWKKDPSVRCIILFGPLAQSGDIGEDSEIDLIIVQHTNQDFLQRLEPFYAETRTIMDILVYTPDEFREMKSRNFLKHVLEAGVVLYGAGPRS